MDRSEEVDVVDRGAFLPAGGSGVLLLLWDTGRGALMGDVGMTGVLLLLWDTGRDIGMGEMGGGVVWDCAWRGLRGVGDWAV